MGACVTRCLPLYTHPRYQPVRSRYLAQDEAVQTEPTRVSRLSSSSDESLCLCDPLEPASTSTPTPQPDEDDPPILVLTPGVTHSPYILTQSSRPSTPTTTAYDIDNDDSLLSIHSCTTNTNANTTTATSTTISQPEDEVKLTECTDQQTTDHNTTDKITTTHLINHRCDNDSSKVAVNWWGSAMPAPIHTALPAASLPSLGGAESPPTASSLDLEWESEAGLGRMSRQSVRTREEDEAGSQTAESNSWVPRSACSTPNSLEWDFRASTLSLRGQEGEEEVWQASDQETEQLLYEIEQLAARALADTGHGLHPNR